MPFQRAVTLLPDQTSLRTFLDTSQGILSHSSQITTYSLLQTNVAIAKNGSYSYTSDRDWLIFGIYPLSPSGVSTVRITLDFFDTANIRYLNRIINFSVGNGYDFFAELIVLPRANRVTITTTEILDRITFVAQEHFVETIRI